MLIDCALLAGCAARGGPEPATAGPAGATPAVAATAASIAAPAAAPLPAQPFDDAVLSAANALLGKAQLPETPAGASPRHALVIDPLIDGMMRAQSQATRSSNG